MLEQLPDDDKLRLLRFMASFAWADLEVGDSERDLFQALIQRFALSADDATLAASWLDHPPAEEDLDPQEIPPQYRQLVLEAALEIMGIDGRVDALEVENYAILEALMGEGAP